MTSQWTHISTNAKSEARGLQRFAIFEIMHWSGKVGSLYDWTLQKIQIISKTAWNKSCAELNFLTKSHRTHISIYPKSGARGSKDLHFWNIIMRWTEKVPFMAERLKNTVYIKKCFKQKLRKIKFPQKNSVNVYLYLLQEYGARSVQRFAFL